MPTTTKKEQGRPGAPRRLKGKKQKSDAAAVPDEPVARNTFVGSIVELACA